jgi:hypothetical protein
LFYGLFLFEEFSDQISALDFWVAHGEIDLLIVHPGSLQIRNRRLISATQIRLWLFFLAWFFRSWGTESRLRSATLVLFLDLCFRVQLGRRQTDRWQA